MSSDKKCCVPGCFEAGGASHPVRLHVFPNPTKEPQRFKAWRLSVGGHILELTNEHIYKYRRVCHAHFEEKFHCRYNRLSNIAIPTLNLGDEHRRNIERVTENIPEVQSALSGVSEVSRPRKRSFTSIQNIGVCLPSTSKEMEEVEQLEADIAELRKLLQCKEGELFDMKQKLLSGPPIHGENGYNTQTVHTNYTPRTQMSNVPKWAIERYSRQILLPDIGVQGQEKLMASKVLVVGAGGLGCPAAVYLAGAGVGEIGIVDYDCVDITNIHRQILHEEKDENTCKADSAADSLRRLNTKIKVTPYNLQLDSKNALQIISHYDLVLDCTDNVPTRFLLNDACVMTKKPLISGSALKMEGQLTLYGYRSENNYNEKDSTFVGPCYRCVFPSPPPPEAVGSCSANGVAGPVPGIIGAMQALEAIKLIVGQTHDALLVGRMLLFDGEDMTFRNVKLRPRNSECAVCSPTPTITSLIDYEVFCKAQAKEKDLDLQVLTPEYRKSATELADEMTQTNVTEKRHLLVDVRSAPEFNMCNIEGAVNYPIEKLYDATLNKLVEDIKESNQVTFICRRGNDSQLAVQKVLELVEEPYRSRIKDLTGGLHAWSKYVDPEFPVY